MQSERSFQEPVVLSRAFLSQHHSPTVQALVAVHGRAPPGGRGRRGPHPAPAGCCLRGQFQSNISETPPKAWGNKGMDVGKSHVQFLLSPARAARDKPCVRGEARLLVSQQKALLSLMPLLFLLSSTLPAESKSSRSSLSSPASKAFRHNKALQLTMRSLAERP